MATQYYRPDVYMEEQDTTKNVVNGVVSSIPGFVGVATRGPVGTPKLITSVDDFIRIYGNPVENESLYFAVKGFFENGGALCYVTRLAHYSDIADRTTRGGVAAYAQVDGIGVATFAQYAGNVDISGGIQVSNGQALVMAVNGGGDKTVTVACAAAVKDGGAGAFVSPVPALTSCTYQINGGPVKTCDISGLTPVSADAAGYALLIGAIMEGVLASVNVAALRLTTDRKGSGASIKIVSATAAWVTQTAVTADVVPITGTGNVADADAVTFTEMKTMIELAVKTATPGDLLLCTQAATGEMVITATAGTAGVGSTLDLKAGSTAALVAALGLTGMGTYDSGPAETGADSGAASAWKFTAGYCGEESPGTNGNLLAVMVYDDPKHASAGVGLDLVTSPSSSGTSIVMTSTKGIDEGSILLLTDTVAVKHEYVKVNSVSVVTAPGGVTRTVNLASALVNSYDKDNSTVVSVEHTLVVYDAVTEKVLQTWPQMSANPLADNYIETVINDSELGSNYVMAENLGLTFPASIPTNMTAATDLTSGTSETTSLAASDVVGNSTAKTGLYEFDALPDVGLITCPPSYSGSLLPVSATTHNAILAYCEARMDCFGLLDSPEGYTKAQVYNYRVNTLGADSKWGALYFPWVEVSDPFGSGSNPTIYVPPSGHIAGLYARVEQLPPPDGGIAAAPAGEGEFGKLKGVVGLAYSVNDAEHNDLNPVGINCIRAFRTTGSRLSTFLVFGARTLSESLQWRYINVRRVMTYAEQSIKRGMRWAILRNNDAATWRRVKTQVDIFLAGMLAAGQLRGTKKSEAYFIKLDSTTTTPLDVEEGRMICEIGLATQKPAEFVIFRIGQMQSGLTVNENA